MDALVQLTGNVGSEVKVTEGEGYTFVRFRLAITPRVRKAEGWGDADTTWITVSASRRLASNAAQSLETGQPVVVVGYLRTRVWFDKQGVQRETQQVEATTIGHDLSRGTAKFFRTHDVFADQAEPASVDRETGEVVEFPVAAPLEASMDEDDESSEAVEADALAA